ncbi:acyltransferase family protein [Hydrogenophaga sp. RWCD_12]|uniref:acyltransferase family protein n=1 Tax=Hydrogenophaga sp. RWCD_12 TaxID=3391190 RepID=UPI003984C143
MTSQNPITHANESLKGSALSVDHTHYAALDGLRGVAALLVVVFHAGPFFGKIVPGGYLAVDMFFVLSGFVIEHAYGQRLRDNLGVWGFTKLRLIRFYPLYLAGLLAGVALELLLHFMHAKNSISLDVIAIQFSFAALFVPAVFEADAFPLNIPAWSLFFELLVNVLYALFAPRLKTAALVLVAAVSLLIFGLYIALGSGQMPGPQVHDMPMAFLRTVFSFTVGVLVYRYRRPFSIDPGVFLLAICFLFLLPLPQEYRKAFDLICIAIVLPAIVWVAAGGEPRIFKSGFAVLGAISYGIYAIHYPLIWLVRGFADRLKLPMAPVGVGMLLALVVVCYWLDKYYDQPVRGWLKRKLTS